MHTIRLLFVTAATSIFALASCNNIGATDDESPVVASVADYKLTIGQVSKQIPDGVSLEDSTAFAKRIIDSWARNKLLFIRAQDNLTDNQSFIEEQVDEFRQSLYIHKFEQELINSSLDFSVNDDAIMIYYLKNKAEMLLSNDIAKVNFLKVPKNIVGDLPIKRWIVSKRDEDIDNLKDFGFQFASKFSFSEEWLDVNFIFNQMPRKITNEQSVLRYKNLVVDSDSTHYYYLQITEYLAKNDTAPISYVRSNVAEILLQMKKNKLLKETRNKLYEDAKNKNTVKFYKL